MVKSALSGLNTVDTYHRKFGPSFFPDVQTDCSQGEELWIPSGRALPAFSTLGDLAIDFDWGLPHHLDEL